MGSAPRGERARPQLKETEFPKGWLPGSGPRGGKRDAGGGGGPNLAFDGRTVLS